MTYILFNIKCIIYYFNDDSHMSIQISYWNNNISMRVNTQVKDNRQAISHEICYE